MSDVERASKGIDRHGDGDGEQGITKSSREQKAGEGTKRKDRKRTFNMRLTRQLAHRIHTGIPLERLLPLWLILHALVEAHEREWAEGEAAHDSALHVR